MDPPVLEETTAAQTTAALTEEIKSVVSATEGSYLGDVNLTDDEKKTVDEFSQKIDLSNTNIVLQYGVACQKKMSDFADTALDNVRTKDLGQVGDMIAGLVTQLKEFDIDEEPKGLFGWLKKKKSDVSTFNAKYASAEANVNAVVTKLEDQQNVLLKDVVMLDTMYGNNVTYFKELTMYILAGKKKLEEEQKGRLVELQNKAKESGLAEDAQKANDFAAQCDRFDKKLHDLELTRTISIQMAPQIRLIQNNDILMSEKITSIVNNTIPLWKNQMVLALGMAHAEDAMKAEKAVTDLTNQLIKENAEKLKTGTVEIAKESEKGIIELETVKYANEQLIASLDEVIKIQEEGRIKRRAAEQELYQIEGTLKQKLLDIRNNSLGSGAEVPAEKPHADIVIEAEKEE
ncbi:MAG: toxic anion resistance protein [Clostridia bacterium]|nr:toxic anion resistance protein [Clostridia bacterium]